NQGGFVNESYIEGDIDFLWGTGAVYFRNSELKMINSNAYYTQIRNGAGKNGYVFVNSRLTAAPGVTGAYLTRIDPDQFPYSQVVFIDSVMGSHIRPEAWRFDDNARDGFLNPLTPAGYPNVRFWEYNTRDENGAPVDTSQRHPISRQMSADEADYWRNPANVLGGWSPEVGGPAAVSLAGLNQTYTGSPVGISVITEPANLAVQVTYNGNPEQPVNVGTYEVVATITEPGYEGTITGTLVIAKAAATVAVDNPVFTYDGTPKAVSVTTEPAGLNVDVTYNGLPNAPTNPGTYAVVATINDVNYQGATNGTLTINEAPNTPPVLTLPADIIVEATTASGATATFQVSAFDAEDGNLPVNLSKPSGSVFALGTTAVTASVTDSRGSVATGSFSVIVRDTTAPVIGSLTSSVSTITQSNGKMIPVTLTANVTDAVTRTPDTRIVSITSNEPVSGAFGGDKSPDWQITGALTASLRAERVPKGNGRIYTITVESRDAAGNVSRRQVQVTVAR
ncbi:MAG TPA: MBG domain-containing protein, partial [Pyrinomonadaceae bacterium]